MSAVDEGEVLERDVAQSGEPGPASLPIVSPRWLVYIIEADDGSLYTGVTTDLARRWGQHASGRGAKYFRGRRPVRFVYVEAEHTRQSAAAREAAIKRLSRGAKVALLAREENRLSSFADQLAPACGEPPVR